MKNLIYGGVIVGCLVVAGVVVFATRGGGPGGIEDLSNETKVWVTCAACDASYEMGEKQFYEQLRQKSAELANPMATARLTCQQCGKDAVVKAVKCEKCGEVFPEGIVPNDFDDRCPKCKHSATEAKRKANLANQN
jgi:predicted Zn-ribbon and HTH transcriptional regulator